MPVNDYLAQDEFFVRIFKHRDGDPDLSWSNVYEVIATGDGGIAELNALGNDLLNYEKQIHYDDILFDRIGIGTWTPDTHPYDPYNTYVIEVPGGTFGGRTAPANTARLPLRSCWEVKRGVLTGRSGKLFYRGCLAETDVEALAGGWDFTDAAAMETILAGSITLNLAEYFTGGGGPFALALIGKNKVGTKYTREVTSFHSRAPVDVQMNHRWYNRAGA